MVVRSSLLIAILFASAAANSQINSFNYQGRLLDNGNPASGSYDFVFKLFDQSTGGTEQVQAVAQNSVLVSNGLFNAELNFGAQAFSGAERWLEINVARTGTPDPVTVLVPRQRLSATPYALCADTANSYHGSIAGDQLPVEVAFTSADQTFTGDNLFNSAIGNFTGTFVGNGAGLTNLNVTASGGLIRAFSGRVNQLPNASSSMFGGAIGFTDSTPNEGEVSCLSPGVNIVAKSLHVRLNIAPGSGKSISVTLRANGVDTPITCTVWDNNLTANSGLLSAVIPAASVLSLRVAAQGAPNSASALFSWSFE